MRPFSNYIKSKCFSYHSLLELMSCVYVEIVVKYYEKKME